MSSVSLQFPCIVVLSLFLSSTAFLYHGFSRTTTVSSKLSSKQAGVEDFKHLLEIGLNHDLPIVDPTRKIYCNVELNCANLEAVGFDMDYTLAQYNTDFDKLAFHGAIDKLISNFGYPKEIRKFEYREDMVQRGLIIDKRRGNILQIDRHKYVRSARHGSRPVDDKDRKRYMVDVKTFTEEPYDNIDTIFKLIDGVLFTYLVDLRDTKPHLFKNKTYENIYSDIRKSVDLCHRDGLMKGNVTAFPEKYLIYDEGTVPMLQQLRQAGKKLFLLTNSDWQYTDKVMSYLVHGRGAHQDIKWQDLFDIIIVSGNKPAFLREEYLSIFRVNETTGCLHNIEDKDGLRIPLPAHDKVFHGGCWQDLHRMLQVSFGDRILYVGDHIFSDILRSKRTLGWRTCLILPELEKEIEVLQQSVEKHRKIKEDHKVQYDLDEYIDHLRAILQERPDMKPVLTLTENKAFELKRELRRAEAEYQHAFNKDWGQVFKADFRRSSRFSKQVTDYACLYTSRASNLGLVSPNRPFRPIADFIPQDQVLFDFEYSDNEVKL